MLPAGYVYVFCTDLKKQRCYPHATFMVVYNGEGECLLRGTSWVFK
jgi:hypothetical protein